MKGRHLLKESPSPSLCAFCAYRLGQARGPSNAHPRLIHSSRPVSTPAAEAAAVRDEESKKPAPRDEGRVPGPNPAWGRSNLGGVPQRGGPSASWGRPGVGALAIPRSKDRPHAPIHDHYVPHERGTGAAYNVAAEPSARKDEASSISVPASAIQKNRSDTTVVRNTPEASNMAQMANATEGYSMSQSGRTPVTNRIPEARNTLDSRSMSESGNASGAVKMPERNSTLNISHHPSGPGIHLRARTAAAWGRPGSDNVASRPGPTIGWDMPGAPSRGVPPSSTGATPSTVMPDDDDLLPHERRAREMILEARRKAEEAAQFAQRRTVLKPTGPGPQTNLAGRPDARQREEEARRAASRREGREAHERRKLQNSEDGRSRPIMRHRLGDSIVLGARSSSGANDRNDLNWDQLKKRQEETVQPDRVQADQRARDEHFAEARAQREQQARSGGYTPLSSRSIFQADSTRISSSRYGSFRSAPARYQESGQQTDSGGRGDYRNGSYYGNVSDWYGHQQQSQRSGREFHERDDGNIPQKGGFLGGQSSVADTWASRHSAELGVDKKFVGGYRGGDERDNYNRADRTESAVDYRGREEERETVKPQQSSLDASSSQTRMLEREEPKEPRPEREARGKKAKARARDEEDAYGGARGKDRDKAKRRAKFARNDEGIEAEGDEALARAEIKKQRKLEKAAKKAVEAAAPTPLLLPEFISVSNLAVALRVRFDDFIRKLEELGFEETAHDHILNAETSGLIAQEYNFEPIIERGESEDLKAREPHEDPTTLPPRPPVVTIMGHVDHGKTTILDYLRKSSVAANEHGGITQHIGAFSVQMPSGKIITFLDTPGHEAFLSMRQRGANVTDIVILVVAADDSVKPQTIEAINHAKNAKVPVIVAINKIDKDEADVDRVKLDLSRYGIDVEDFGGDTQVVCVSGKTGQGMDELEEAAVALSELIDMRAETDGPAEGWVLEASVKSMGKVATVLVRRGTMRPGDFIVAGNTWARIRNLRNEAGVEVDEATPGQPVQIDGWREQPLAGDEVLQAPDESKAKSVTEYRRERDERDKMAEDMDAINETRKEASEKRDQQKAEAAASAAAKKAGEDKPQFEHEVKAGGPKQVCFVIKGDVSGSVEAVVDSISAVGNHEVQPHILRSGVGQLAEFDVEYAAAAKGHLINFNTPIEPHIATMAAAHKVNILDHNIIYKLVDDVKAELSKELPPLITQGVLGEAEISQIFEINIKGRKHKAIAGCKVRNGTITRAGKVRVMRRGEKVFDGSLSSMKNVKRDVQEMNKGGECGIGFEEWTDFQVGDNVQAYEEKSEKRYL